MRLWGGVNDPRDRRYLRLKRIDDLDLSYFGELGLANCIPCADGRGAVNWLGR